MPRVREAHTVALIYSRARDPPPDDRLRMPPRWSLLTRSSSRSARVPWPHWPWTSCNIRDKRGPDRVKRFKPALGRILMAAIEAGAKFHSKLLPPVHGVERVNIRISDDRTELDQILANVIMGIVFGDIGIRGDLCIETDNEIVRERGFGLREHWENWNFPVESKG